MGQTPGSWTVGTEPLSRAWLHVRAGSTLVATIPRTKDTIPDVRDDLTAQANARLIAAAPDMLAALEKFRDWPGGERGMWGTLIGEVVAAINKGSPDYRVGSRLKTPSRSARPKVERLAP